MISALIIIGCLLTLKRWADNVKVPTDTIGDGFPPERMRMLSYNELKRERRNAVHSRR